MRRAGYLAIDSRVFLHHLNRGLTVRLVEILVYHSEKTLDLVCPYRVVYIPKLRAFKAGFHALLHHSEVCFRLR